MRKLFCLVLLVLLTPGTWHALAGEEAKTVLGPRNIHLYDGAQELMAGRGEKGVRLTLLGLEIAQGSREKKIAHSNLCAGFMMIDEPENALPHCDWVLERYPSHWRTYNNRALVYMQLGRLEEAEVDIRRGQEINPRSKTLKIVKGMYLDEVEPVEEKIEADERRSPIQDPPDDGNPPE